MFSLTDDAGGQMMMKSISPIATVEQWEDDGTTIEVVFIDGKTFVVVRGIGPIRGPRCAR